ncbi:hypothetical protein RchiOBHm_Chr7g0210791 [Rosa chinensis]|uniref:Uncharacterized protein n=1 Tax=Rosa chinensis TaxID=74649 RepID=A0A2P6PAA0_ROSCH|nr:hypothetical protein RchiOBHm_Chr7g0210791 [Rosa chinensis]
MGCIQNFTFFQFKTGTEIFTEIVVQDSYNTAICLLHNLCIFQFSSIAVLKSRKLVLSKRGMQIHLMMSHGLSSSSS